MNLIDQLKAFATRVGQDIRDVRNDLLGKSDKGHTHTAEEITDLPDFPDLTPDPDLVTVYENALDAEA